VVVVEVEVDVDVDVVVKEIQYNGQKKRDSQ
jgi:hypothetical protein